MSEDSRICTVGASGYLGGPAGPLYITESEIGMSSVAVFVDAGYLYKAGAHLIAGRPQSQSECRLLIRPLLDKLRQVALARSDGARLLRTYWYDGLLRGAMSPDQRELAFSDDVKLRLGIVNTRGEQKGVDSLIVMDFVELARNGAITDAVLVSGDEDVRIGVQLAQSFGVRVHLQGIEPSRSNQSDLLIQEADTVGEWCVSDVAEVLVVPSHARRVVTDTSMESEPGDDFATTINKVIGNRLARCGPSELREIESAQPGRIPKDIHGPLLGAAREQLGRNLEHSERELLNAKFREKAVEMLSSVDRSNHRDAHPNTP